MGFQSVRSLAASLDDGGKSWTSWFHKSGGPAAQGAGRWADMSMGAGTPKYNAYVGSQFAATPLTNAGNDGVYLGPGSDRYLAKVGIHSTAATIAPATFLLCDYLMHYPLIDGDDTAQQDLDNTAALPRYQSGNGVRCMAVCTTPMTANVTCTVTYTNSDGIAGRSSTFNLLASSVVGCIVTTPSAANAAAPFMPLASGDKGIRSIEAITLAAGAGGFFALVLVRPLAHINLREQNTFTEIEGLRQRGALPSVKDGAYLNFIYTSNGSGSAVPLRGFIEFAW